MSDNLNIFRSSVKPTRYHAPLSWVIEIFVFLLKELLLLCMNIVDGMNCMIPTEVSWAPN